MALTGQKFLIGILEDDDAVRDSLSLMLERNGFAVRAFGSPSDFLVTPDMDRFSCLVIDFQLPGMNGLELLELPRFRACSKPAIVIAAGADSALADRMRNAGVSDLLRKPVAPEALLRSIRSAIEGKSARAPQLRT